MLMGDFLFVFVGMIYFFIFFCRDNFSILFLFVKTGLTFFFARINFLLFFSFLQAKRSPTFIDEKTNLENGSPKK